MNLYFFDNEDNNSLMNINTQSLNLEQEIHKITLCENLGKLCRVLFYSAFLKEENLTIFKDNHSCSTETIIMNIFNALDNHLETKIFSSDINMEIITIISTIYISLGKMLTTETNVFTVDEQQQYTKVKLIDYLKKIEQNDAHSFTNNCSNQIHKCSYHIEDLFTHLHLSCIISLFYVIKSKKELTTFELMKHATIALLHDIGKPICKVIDSNTNHIMYPFHGEMGAGLLLQLWSPNFGQPFTKTVWEEICRTICVHMCGYHYIDFENENTQYKLNLLTCESTTVKDNLVYLSYGDHLGRIKKKDVDNVNPTDFIESRDKFRSLITRTQNINDLMKSCKFTGIIIFIRGNHKSGKSTIVKQIINLFNEKKISCAILEHIGSNTKFDIDLYMKTNKIVIVELSTEQSYSSSTLEMHLPFTIQDSLVISIDTIRNKSFDNIDNNDYTKICNYKKSVDSWLPFNAFSDLKNITSYSTSKYACLQYRQNYPKSRPKICFVVAFNEFDNIGHSELFRQLDYFSSLYKICTSPTVDALLVPDASTPNETNFNNAHSNINTDDMDIIQYCNELYHTTSWGSMIEIIKSQFFMVECPSAFKQTPFKNRVIKIKYFEHNRMWRAKWARQCRGIILYLDDDNNIIPLKYQLQRGAEVLTSVHLTNGIDSTNDTNNTPAAASYFDNDQQIVINKLLNDEYIDGVLSFKSDGSLLGITCYFEKYANMVDKFVDEYGDEFCKTFHQLGKQYGLTCVVSSQGTFAIGVDMQPYTVTAILGDMFNDNEIIQIRNENPNYCDALKKYGKQWLDKISAIIKHIISTHPDAISITVNFESICKNRISAWEITQHTELAMSYDSSITRFLGVSICGKKYVKFIPHFDITTVSELAKLNINEPCYWKIKTSMKVNEMLKDLELVASNKITNQKFFENHKPDNVTPNIITNLSNYMIDFEGFVFLTNTQNTQITGEYNYNKIKTTLYYKAHHFKFCNVGYLIGIADTCGDVFPLAKKVKDFFDSTPEKLSNSLEEIVIALFKSPNTNTLFANLPEKAKKSFTNKPLDTQIKMLINGSTSFEKISHDIFSKHFPSLKKRNNPNIDDELKRVEGICKTIKSIVMKLELWKSQDIVITVQNYSNNIYTEMELQQLLFYCINS